MKFRGKWNSISQRCFAWTKEKKIFFPQMPKIAQGKSICCPCNSYWKDEIFEIHVTLYRDIAVNKMIKTPLSIIQGRRISLVWSDHIFSCLSSTFLWCSSEGITALSSPRKSDLAMGRKDDDGYGATQCLHLHLEHPYIHSQTGKRLK